MLVDQILTALFSAALSISCIIPFTVVVFSKLSSSSMKVEFDAGTDMSELDHRKYNTAIPIQSAV